MVVEGLFCHYKLFITRYKNEKKRSLSDILSLSPSYKWKQFMSFFLISSEISQCNIYVLSDHPFSGHYPSKKEKKEEKRQLGDTCEFLAEILFVPIT